MDAIEDNVRSIIAGHIKMPLESLTPDTLLTELDVKSLDLIEIVFAIEEKFDISIPYNANEGPGKDALSKAGLEGLETVGQIVEAVRKLQGAKAPA